MLNIWSVISCIFVHWTKKLTLVKLLKSWKVENPTLLFMTTVYCCLSTSKNNCKKCHTSPILCMLVCMDFFANLNAIKNRHGMWKILYQSWSYSYHPNNFLFFSILYISRNYGVYSKVSIIRPGRSRLLEFERRQYWSFNRDFFQISRQGLK